MKIKNQMRNLFHKRHLLTTLSTIISVVVIISLLVISIGCSPPSSSATSTKYTVEYLVEGVASRLDISLVNSAGETERIDIDATPSRFTYHDYEGNYASITVWIWGIGAASVSIFVNGELFKTSSGTASGSGGSYTTVTASGYFR